MPSTNRKPLTWFGLESCRWVFILQRIPPIILGSWTLVHLDDRPSKASWLPALPKHAR